MCPDASLGDPEGPTSHHMRRWDHADIWFSLGQGCDIFSDLPGKTTSGPLVQAEGLENMDPRSKKAGSEINGPKVHFMRRSKLEGSNEMDLRSKKYGPKV